jgi:hypothetical protein
MKILTLALLLCTFSVSAETRLEVGPTYLSDQSSDGYMVVISERMGKFDIGVGYVSEQDVWPKWEKRHGYGPAHLERNSFIYGQRIWSKGKFELGIGAAHFSNKNRALGQRTTWPVTLGWNFNKDVSIRLRHFSNAGSATPNLGQDAVTLAWTF